MKSNPIVPGDIPIMDIEYRYKSQKVLVFIATEGDVITDTSDNYLYCLLEKYSNEYIHHFVSPCTLVRYFIFCNVIDQRNYIRQYDLALYKYWAIQSEYFRLMTTVALDMGII